MVLENPKNFNSFNPNGLSYLMSYVNCAICQVSTISTIVRLKARYNRTATVNWFSPIREYGMVAGG
jgi:hypothetical protein